MDRWVSEKMNMNRRAEDFEWIETNGIGGYASSTPQFSNRRKYHGLLVCALNPPVNRHVIVSNVDEKINGRALEFRGYRFKNFPEFEFVCNNIFLTKRVFMIHEKNTTVVRYTMKSFDGVDFKFELLPIVAFRHIYSTSDGNLNLKVEKETEKLRIEKDGTPLTIKSSSDFDFFEERKIIKAYYAIDDERKESCYEDLNCIGKMIFNLKTPCSLSLALSLNVNEDLEDDFDEIEKEEEGRREALKLDFYNLHQCSRNEILDSLILSADRFIVNRDNGRSIIAGYHWFSDWGRDAMIALPGLTLVTKRFPVAKEILLTFAAHEKNGLIPNGFAEDNSLMYNSVDTSLWFIDRVYRYFLYTNDVDFLKDVWDKMDKIIYSFIEGTDYGIKMDEDYLIAHGDQLTWMDAVVDRMPCTPRGSKAVEVQALWYNALKAMERMANFLQYESNFYKKLSYGVEKNFERKFFNEGYLADRIGNNFVDSSIRPNQILATSLEFSPVHRETAEKVFNVVRGKLLTDFGLRTLDRDDDRYIGRYGGSIVERDRAYHTGTVWPWLMGPFATSYLKLKDYSKEARVFAYEKLLWPLMEEARMNGNLEEVCSGDEPFKKGGCVSQAWSVAELLRCYCEDILLERPNYAPSFLED